jgi:hypothetical protein
MWICVCCWPAGDAGNMICEMSAGTHEALEFAGTSINFRSGKFGYSICPFFSKGHAEIFREFWHGFAKNKTYGVLRLMHGPGILVLN